MHVPDATSSRFTASIAAALVLLAVLTFCGWQVLLQVRMAPGTVPTAGALSTKQATNDMRPSDTVVTTAGPSWDELTAAQKLALQPLAKRWPFLSELQKRRWLVLAQSFASLPAPEQAKLHERMTEWANLSAQQRNQARLNFATANKLAPDNKRAQWEAYQALSSEEKRRLAAGAAPRPTGAATALRPVPARKLAQVPAATATDANRLNPPKIPPLPGRLPRPNASAPTPDTRAVNAEPIVVETAPVSIPIATPLPLPALAPSSAPTETSAPAEPESPYSH